MTVENSEITMTRWGLKDRTKKERAQDTIESLEYLIEVLGKNVSEAEEQGQSIAAAELEILKIGFEIKLDDFIIEHLK